VKRTIIGICVVALAASTGLYAQEAERAPFDLEASHPTGGHVVIPASSVAHPIDDGIAAHTNFRVFVPPGRPEGRVGFEENQEVDDTTPVAGYYAETPASLACLYGLVTKTTGCNPATLPSSKDATGGARAIAIVDAYDYPTALADLKKYSAEFGLPAPTTATLTVTWASATKPPTDPNCTAGYGFECWEAEESLDLDMAHAAAPKAHLYLVEAKSNSFADLLAAEKKAISLVAAAGGGEVSNSWGGGEGAGETADDADFVGTKVVVFASTGDEAGTEYPSTSPNVVAVGGTTLNRSPSTLDIEAETAWEDGGGGVSSYEKIPSYQAGVAALKGVTHRAVPDVAAVGNPITGVWTYDSFDNTYEGTLYPWNIFGGTSVASPLWAGVVNHAGHFNANSKAELTEIYANAATATDYRDITGGFCGYYDGWFAVKGWDPCTGNGAPLGAGGK
jgi:subtilase family serine protease